MKKAHFKHIFIELYGINIYWVRCSREKYIELVIGEFGLIVPGKDAQTAATFEVYMRQPQAIPVGVIWLSREAELPAMVHEAFHAVHWLSDLRGLYLADSSEESYAYLLEYIMSKLTHKG